MREASAVSGTERLTAEASMRTVRSPWTAEPADRLEQRLHVADPRKILQDHGPRDEEGRRDEGERLVLVPSRLERPLDGAPALDGEQIPGRRLDEEGHIGMVAGQPVGTSTTSAPLGEGLGGDSPCGASSGVPYSPASEIM